MSSELDDVTLRRAQRGEPAALRTLIVHYQTRIASHIARLVGRDHKQAVEDIAQETFLGVLESIERFQIGGSAKLSTWILTIATRRAIDHLRGSKSMQTHASIDDALESIGDDGLSAAVVYEQRQRQAHVERGLRAMSADHRAILLLREYEELDYADIATALQLDVGTVRSRLSRARTSLREHLAEVSHDQI